MENKKKFISPSGALLAVVCFFMPWIKISCMDKTQYFSGAELARDHGQHIFWLLLACAIVMLLVFAVGFYKRRLDLAKPIVLVCAVSGLVILLFKYLDSGKGIKTDMGVIRPEDLGLSVSFGMVGTAIGFVVALVGTFFLKREMDAPTDSMPAPTKENADLQLPDHGDDKPAG